ncbi:arylamine N-acetyltransferase [Candidatus Berkiella aquae]|uniref:Arylamine N-acetyltransferase n=1 Tax=Candidatus Berkiella aquae TaxID=295108 RepID=A0A0Q9YJE7_9GAMM|nr:arylamine N-acetyltransferase [Candidatus Berkiella aquae]MCS5710641.1 arylamine N-acetyltransferase [Candidatus Berkiella aquae]
MPPTAVQIKEYLKKIGFEGEPSVTLECLTQIVEAHSFAFPFETLSLHDSHLDHRPNHRTSLNFDALFRKLVHGNGRGGRCVELNTLLQTMLKALNFKVRPILGEDLLMSSHLPRRKRPRHSAGIVKIGDDKFLVDAAFGGIGIIAPVPLKPGEYQQYSEKFRLTASKEYTFELQIYRNGQPQSIYGFSKKAVTQKAFADLNKRNANVLNTQSLFKTFFSCTKPFKISEQQNGRYNITNNKFSISKDNNTTHREKIDSQARLHELLGEYFNIDLSKHYIRHNEVDMLAYQQGITRPPTLHRFNTRLKERYQTIKDSVETKNAAKETAKATCIVCDDPNPKCPKLNP